ncbi:MULTISPECIES: hypothetical protein [unclassified Phenylobacterium]|uniref:hypothetical protein n=1 Tax=unclassified Phenylobacterium TaxID=2640670 RepID=UPI00083AAE1D|nr:MULTISPECIES: hypothetical protein [unclassified Phenylobacterium]
MGFQDDLTAAATEELDRAMSLGWAQLSKHTPWGDTYEGFTPEGREVCFERAYMWEGASGGDIRVEVSVYEPRAFEDGVRLTRMITKDGSDG